MIMQTSFGLMICPSYDHSTHMCVCVLSYIARKLGPCFRAPLEINVLSVILLSNYVEKSCSWLIPRPFSGKCLEDALLRNYSQNEQATGLNPWIINKKQELRSLIWNISFRLALSVRSYISFILCRFGHYFECDSEHRLQFLTRQVVYV